MDYIIEQRLTNIENLARHQQEVSQEILRCVQRIYGYCAGIEAVASDYPPAPKQNNFIGCGNQQSTVTLEEIKNMIVELNIKGSIRQRANGLIELRTQTLGSIYGRTKEEIEAKLTQKLKEAKKKTKNKDKFNIPINFDKFAIYWFENFHKRKVCDRTYDHDIKLYNRHIKKRFEKFKVKAVNAVMLQDFLDNAPGMGKTAKDLHSILKQILDCAVKHGLIQLNPLGMCILDKYNQEHGTLITKDEELKLEKAYKGTEWEIPLAVVRFTGLRPDEYTSATIDGEFIKAKNSKHGKNGEIVYKYIPITPMLRPYLQDVTKLNMPKPRVLNNRFKKVLPYHKLYDMRTTFQTRCTECGINETVIGLFMGNSIGKLKEAYTDFSKEYLLEEAKKFKY